MTARRYLFFSLSTLAVGCATAYRGFLELFSVTLPYDDTGYMLSLIKGFNEHGHLYQATFSQYGPFYSEFYYFVCGVLGVPITHDGIRWVVLVFWVFSSITGAILAFRFTGRIWMAILAQLICFHALDRMAWEPGHPLSLVVAGLAFLALCLSGKESEQPKVWQAIAIGMGLGALLTIKINIGVFALAAVGTAWIYSLPMDVPGKALRYAAAFLFAIPFLLIQTSWPAPIRAYFAVLFICSLLSVLISASARKLEWRGATTFGLWSLTALLLTCAFSIGGALLSGSTLTDLIDGMITTPSRMGSFLFFAPPMGPFEAVTAIIGLLLAVTWRFSFQTSPIRQDWFTLGLRLLFLTAVIVWLATADHYFSLVLPFVWVAALPFNQASQKSNTPVWQFGQVAIVLLAVGQVLGIYPVNGAHAAVPFYLGAVCAVLGIASLRADLEMKAQSLFAPRRGLAIVVNIALVVVVVGVSWRVVQIAAGRYRHFSPLGLPGAKLLRTDETSAATYYFLVANLRDCRPSFLTIPGVNSLYTWLEREPPTGFNVGMNFAFLSPEQQSAMVNVGRTSQPIAAVLNRKLIGFWTRGHFQPSGPLIDFVTKECRPVGRVNNYELMALLNAPPPKLTSCVTLDKEWQADAAPNQITVFLPANTGAITSAFLLQAASSGTTLYRLETATNSDGVETAAGAATSGPRQFTIYLRETQTISKASLDQTLIQLKDDSGHIINLPFLRPPGRRRSE